MKRLLKDNPIGLGLAAACGALVFIMAVLGIASLLSGVPEPDPEDAAQSQEELSLPELAESPPLDSFYVITERPLFNESRQPVLEEELDQQAFEESEEEEVDAPDVELSGVVITPSLRMAMLKKKEADRSLVAFEGRPIEDTDFGSWQVSRVSAREVLLTSGGGEELRLELKVHDEKIAPPDRPARPAEDSEPAQEESAVKPEEPDTGGRMSRAEEIRQRIAERREELRRQAEEEEQTGEEQSSPNYQQAIRSMIGRNRRNGDDNQEEQ